ncbi:MAG: hypothetical protein ACJ8AG_29730, partial [Ktedonobacteraceae bacterium]
LIAVNSFFIRKIGLMFVFMMSDGVFLATFLNLMRMEIRNVIPTSPTSEHLRFVICGWAISRFHLLRCLRHRI